MSYTNIIRGGSSVERVGNPSFDDQLAKLQEQIDEGGGGGSVPTGTGLRHVTDGVEDGTAYTLSAAEMLLKTSVEGVAFDSNLLSFLAGASTLTEKLAVSGFSSALGSNANARSNAIDTSKYSSYSFLGYVDRQSATNGAKIYASLDGTSYHPLYSSGSILQATWSANVFNTFASTTSFVPPYLKLDLTNGATAQTNATELYGAGTSGSTILGATKTLIQPTLLGNGGVYTSPAYNVSKVRTFGFFVQSDAASASSGVKIETSPDGVSWRETASPGAISLAAGSVALIVQTSGVTAPFARLSVTNGATPQTIFNVYAVIGKAG